VRKKALIDIEKVIEKLTKEKKEKATDIERVIDKIIIKKELANVLKVLVL